MKPEEQRIAIAEACGWTGLNIKPARMAEVTRIEGLKDGKYPCYVPDYLNDLNAMHKAEKTVFSAKPGHYDRYFVNMLRMVLDMDDSNGMLDLRDAFQLTQASAVQHAEAFLRTINKWKD